MLGENKLKDFNFNPKLDGYAIKQPVFSFNKFPDVNKQLGPEMKSTGESILFIDDLNDDEMIASNYLDITESEYDLDEYSINPEGGNNLICPVCQTCYENQRIKAYN